MAQETGVLLSGASRLPFTPPWLEGQDVKPVFLLRAGSVVERAEYEAELDAAGAADVVWLEYDREFATGIAALLPDAPDDVARLTELLAQERSGEPLTDLDKATLAQVREQLDQYWPGWQALKRREARRRALAPIFAFRMFVAGWDNVTGVDGQPVDFVTDIRRQVADGALARIDPTTILVTGWQAHALQYNRGAAKNSAPPLKSAESPVISEAEPNGSSTD